MAGTKNHDYHILPPDIWPLMGALSALTMTSGLVLSCTRCPAARAFFWQGLGVALTLFSWWGKVVKEAHGAITPRWSSFTSATDDPVHRVGSDVLRRLVLGLLRFLAVPVENRDRRDRRAMAAQGDRGGHEHFRPALLNTLILLCSGTTLTWAHHALIHDNRKDLKRAVGDDPAGMMFSSIQAYEYVHAPFAFGKNTYGSVFYMATGFHGFHVIVGTIFLDRLPRAGLSQRFHPAPAFRL
jgi:cytochrome c oxidase subunit 3